MQISQIYLTDNGSPPSPFLETCIQSVLDILPGYPYKLYGFDQARDFLRSQFEPEVLHSFDALRPYAYKADLLRYCLLYDIGGWYFDIAVKPIESFDLSSHIETIAFRDMQRCTSTNWSCQNSVLFSRPRSSVYETAIKLVLENVRNQHYGINAVCPTGPVLLGKAFALTGESHDRMFGDYMFLTPTHHYKNPAFVFPSGLIFALGKPAEGGDLTELGGLGTNNYNDFYESGTVYATINECR
jgi:mannosyltransferase OCH1-like enzyme